MEIMIPRGLLPFSYCFYQASPPNMNQIPKDLGEGLSNLLVSRNTIIETYKSLKFLNPIKKTMKITNHVYLPILCKTHNINSMLEEFYVIDIF